jgi:PIN domain nuclease of toxin-antitoxin system
LRLLLDTNALVWTVLRPHRLSRRALEAIGDTRNTVFVSVINAWEIAIKASQGKLPVPDDIEARIRRACNDSGFDILAVELPHAFEVRRLPPHHKDPFDRMLVAQARIEGMTLVSSDGGLRAYGVDILW